MDVFHILGVTDNQLLEAMLEKAFNICIDNEKRSTSDIPEDYELKVMTPSWSESTPYWPFHWYYKPIDHSQLQESE